MNLEKFLEIGWYDRSWKKDFARDFARFVNLDL
jgi:hypothetical protein